MEVRKFSNVYAVGEKGLGGGHNHNFKTISEMELVRFDGVLTRAGLRGIIDSGMHRMWLNEDPDCDEFMARSMKFSRFLQIKRVIKLNNHLTTPSRGMDGHDPAAKCDLVFDVLVNNMNCITAEAALDQTIDETM